MLRSLCIALASMICAAHPSAHEYWIEPSSFEPALRAPVGVGLRVGSGWPGESRARDLGHLRRFGAVDARGERVIPGEHGDTPAGVTAPRVGGATWLVYRSGATDIEIDAATFETYLREEGHEWVIAERARRSDSARPGRERYSRNAKALLRVGGHAAGFDRVTGLALELVLEHDPAARAPGEPLRLRLLHRGRPLAGTLVKAFLRPAPGAAAAPALGARTDARGRVALPIEGRGVWLINAVQVQRARAGAAHDWESLWSSLTFEQR